LYAYRCTQCGHKFEKIQNFSDEPEQVCPKCGGVLERPLTAPRLQFKGAGWYVNDYAPKSSATAESSSTDKKETSSEPAAVESKKPGDSAAPAASAPASAPASTPSSSTSTTS
jgi:putative FmdB family regulatory protein